MSFRDVVNSWMVCPCWWICSVNCIIIDTEPSSYFWHNVCHSMINVVSPSKIRYREISFFELAKCWETPPCCEREHDDVIKWKHFPRYWPFARGIYWSPVNSPHKGQWCGALVFSLICAWINAWVNNREAGNLRRHRAHLTSLEWVWFLTTLGLRRWFPLDLSTVSWILWKSIKNWVMGVWNPT